MDDFWTGFWDGWMCGDLDEVESGVSSSAVDISRPSARIDTKPKRLGSPRLQLSNEGLHTQIDLVLCVRRPLLRGHVPLANLGHEVVHLRFAISPPVLLRFLSSLLRWKRFNNPFDWPVVWCGLDQWLWS